MWNRISKCTLSQRSNDTRFATRHPCLWGARVSTSSERTQSAYSRPGARIVDETCPKDGK